MLAHARPRFNPTMSRSEYNSARAEQESDESTDIQTCDYGPGGDYVDQRFLAEGRYDY